jgi:protein-S-isoprenylcysteine O-methyltransferase Ste14
MKSTLTLQALKAFIGGVILIGLLIFLPAGTLHFPGGWRLMGALFGPILILGIVLLLRNPELLQKRLSAKEKEGEQRVVVALSGVMFLVAFIVAGLDYRYGWSALPEWLSWLGVGLFLLSYLLYAEVMRENAYLSRTIEVQEGQRVVDSGLYGIVRHPMYGATLLMFLSMPLILGSIYSLIVMLAYIPIIGARMRNEEMVLEAGLEGYKEYKQKVRYKVIPLIW